jgi:hypothetical protein
MKEFNIESYSSNNEKKEVKTRKDFVCDCCEKLLPKGSVAKSYKCVNGTDFFELKFCENCKENEHFIVKTAYN